MIDADYKEFGKKQFYPIGATNLYFPKLTRSFFYSDGDEIERDIFELITRAKDKQLFSKELISGIRNWATEYHLSPRRANVLRFLKGIDSSTRVLELGCGCGAITRYLGELGCQVDAVEGSPARARIANARVSEQQNINIFCSDFSELSFDSTYDIVTLIGVLEYAPLFFETTDPIKSCLEIAYRAIKDDGMLVLAIENQLGLKYFAGIPEDHYGIPYYGIEDQYSAGRIITFGRNELTDALNRSGFASVEFNYPFPDYKLPQAVISQAGLDSAAFDESDIISERLVRYDELTQNFDVSSASKALSRNNLLGDLSNSFLVVAQKILSDRFREQNLLGEVYTDDRLPAYNTCTRFLNIDGTLITSKVKLSEEKSMSTRISLNLEDDLYIKGKVMTHLIEDLLNSGDESKAFALITRWVSYLGERAVEHEQLPGDYFDAIPQNFIITPDDELCLFDKEWHLGGLIELNLVIMRGVLSLVSSARLNRYFSGSNDQERARFLWENLDIQINFEEWWDEARSFNRELGENVYDHGSWIIRRNLNREKPPFLLKVKRVMDKLVKCLKTI